MILWISKTDLSSLGRTISSDFRFWDTPIPVSVFLIFGVLRFWGIGPNEGERVDAIHMSGMPKWHLRLSSDFSALQRLELRPGAEITARLLLFEFTHPFSFCPVIGSVSVGFLLPFLLVIKYYQGRDYPWKHGLCENTNFSKHCVSGPG